MIVLGDGKKNIISKINRTLSEKMVHGKIAPHLQPILLHKLYASKSDIVEEWGTVDEGFTVENLDTMISWFRKRNYHFIRPSDIINTPLDTSMNYILLTFDEGYYNNMLALPVLEKHQVHATFFISTGHIKSGKGFWWDIIYRNRIKQGIAKPEVMKEMDSLMQKSYTEQENFLVKEFGENALQPLGDQDRPMTPAELKTFSEHPLVELGNHTHYHLNMNNYAKQELKNSVLEAHKDLVEMTGKAPLSFAYPYGIYNDEVLEVIREFPYKIAVTTVEEKMQNEQWMNKEKLLLNRKHFVGWIDIEDQCYNIYSGYSLASDIKKKLFG